MPFEIFYCDMLVSTIPAMQYWLAKQSLKQIKLYFIALNTKQLIKEAKKCTQLSRYFAGMENLTFREKHVG